MSFEKLQFQPRTMPKEEFFSEASALTGEELRQLDLGKKEKKSLPENVDPVLRTTFRNPETRAEQAIEINLQKKISECRTFYRDNFNLSINEAEIRSVWDKNYAEIKSESEKYGYDSIIIVPDNLPSESDVNKKAIETMDEGTGKGKVAATKYWVEQQSISSIKENKYKIILIHSAQNLADQPLLKATKGKNIIDLAGIDKAEVEKRIASGQELAVDFKVEIGGQEIEIKADSLSLEEYEIFQRMYFEKNRKHLDESGWTWLMKSRSGSRVVSSCWDPDARRLAVAALVPDSSRGSLGLRLSRSFSS